MAAPAVLNPFDSEAFTTIAMTAAINKQPFVPGRIGEMGIFEPVPITTTAVMVEEDEGTLALVPNVPRGGDPTPVKKDKRKARSLLVPHLPVRDSIMADEIQNVRAFGSTALQSIEQVRDRQLRKMTSRLDATVEYGRIGALKGVIYDSDGSTVIYNLFTEFGVSQDTVDFVLGTTTTNIIAKCADVLGYIEDALGAAVYSDVRVVCGKTWWQNFIGHTAVRDAYKYFEANGQRVNPLREDLRFRGFPFGGMIFEQYRGSVGGVGFIADSEAHAFPVGVPGLYLTHFAPADYVETANTPGLPRYAKAEPKRFNKGLDLEAQTNPLSICTRPKVLVKLTTS